VRLDCFLRLDAVVSGTVIVEIKSIERFAPVHEAQLLTYLKLTGLPAGLLINFNVPVMKRGLRRLLNTIPRP
jgi:GxxExxY protein